LASSSNNPFCKIDVSSFVAAPAGTAPEKKAIAASATAQTTARATRRFPVKTFLMFIFVLQSFHPGAAAISFWIMRQAAPAIVRVLQNPVQPFNRQN
jgi:hypothetical protein